jgi:hypothetical protein
MTTTQITLAQCRALASNPGFALRSDAADAWDRACRAFGATVLLSGAWRSYETQERLFRERYVPGNHAGKAGYTRDVRTWQGQPWTRRTGTAAAAVPGTSNHGGGIAVDAKTARSAGDPAHPAAVTFTSFKDPDRARFLSVAGAHGWADDEGRSVDEPWHLTNYPGRDKHATAQTGGGLVVDGIWGTSTTRRLQQVLGTPADGIVSSQPRQRKAANPGLTSGWDWTPNPKGSAVVRALQGRIGAGVDGLVGPATFRALQQHLGTPVDGTVSRPSAMVRALQVRLNEGRL